MKISKYHTPAVNGVKTELWGQTTLNSSFDITRKHQIDVTAWLLAINECKPNLMEMDLLKITGSSFNIFLLNLILISFPETLFYFPGSKQKATLTSVCLKF